jgi:uncharacterized membrane protein YphA (DoxX/SURF4 family)
MNIILWIAQVLLAGMYLMAGYRKAFTPETMAGMRWAKFNGVGLVRFIGTMELLGAVGMLLPILTGVLPWLTPLAAIGLALIQLLAIFTVHLPKKEYKALPTNIILLVLAVFVAIGRWGLLG